MIKTVNFTLGTSDIRQILNTAFVFLKDMRHSQYTSTGGRW